MSELGFWGHPLTVTVIGAGIIGVLVQTLTWWWQNQRKAWEVRVSLVAEMSEVAMDLMARLETTLDLEELANTKEKPGFWTRWRPFAQVRHRFEYPATFALFSNSRARVASTNAAQQFVVHKAVVGTKLEAYLWSPRVAEREEKASPTIADRWDKLSKAMTNLVTLKQLDTPHDHEHCEKLLDELVHDMTDLIQCEQAGTAKEGNNPEKVLQNVVPRLNRLRDVLVDGEAQCNVHGTIQAFREVLNAVLERKRVLIVEVRDAPMAFRTPWLPRARSRVPSTRRNR